MPSDDESIRMEKPKSILEPTHSSGSNQTPAPSKKHVSFARSHTLTSFDDAIVSLNSSSTHLGKMTRSQERLLDVRKSEIQPITRQPEPSENVLLIDKLKRTPMKCQATQTEACLGRKPIVPGNINLSPRTIHRVKMVSQGAQTNGFLLNGRRLTKSFSEAGSRFQGIAVDPDEYQDYECIPDHEPLQRTQSDEPPRSPRSPYILNQSPPIFPEISPPPPPSFSETSSVSKSDHESEESETKREIFIDFKPQVPPVEAKLSKRPLTKAMSDGEILLDQLKDQKNEILSPVKQITSVSQEYLTVEEETPRTFIPYFQKSPIRHEGIFKKLDDSLFSSASFDESNIRFHPQDSMDEEFHENLIYNRMYINHQDSLERSQENLPRNIESHSPNDECVVPSISTLSEKKSPFNSNDSLANDIRDHSDGIWNESQATVLQVDSGTDNGTAISSSEMPSLTSPGSVNLLTPSSRRRHLLLLQHQQRSSIDTENLDEEFVEQTQLEVMPRIIINKPIIQHQQDQISRQKNIPNHKIISSSSAPWKRRVPDSPAKSPQPAVVPDLLLARTDSCKTNTDVSESTTTDDYITANSGTDSSRKSGSTSKGNDIYSTINHPHQAFDESSFESTKGDFLDEMVVPSVLPPLADETTSHSHSLSNTPVPHESRTGRSTPSETSSSCGSYSVDGSCPDLLGRDRVPSKPSGDDRYSRYSSSGCYESPPEDEISRHSLSNETVTEPQQKKRPYVLEINKHQEVQKLSPSEKYRNTKKDVRVSPSKDHHKSSDKPKRTKMRTRSPMQNHKKSIQKKSFYLRTDAIDDDRFKRSVEESKATSDESSCDFGVGKYVITQTSPRKLKKGKDSNRRKSLPRSPIAQPVRRGSDEKSVSLPGSLQRRKSTKSKNLQPEDALTTSHSPAESPNSKSSKSRSPQSRSPENTKLKALSAESLRSVSPGSDSVFYSDPSSHTADHQVHCLHCGKEVDIITTTDVDKSSNSSQHDIVQPPAGFEDSPKLKHPSSKLYKKLNRRIRSEERTLVEQRRHRYKPDVRAKSEERDGTIIYTKKLRPLDRSTTSSREILKTTDSSPCILPGAPDDEDDSGVYDVPYTEGFWICLDEKEMQSKANSPTDQLRRSSVSSTESEQEFKKRYQSVIHRMVHRKSCLEMYKRQTSRSFGKCPVNYCLSKQMMMKIIKASGTYFM
ncbi:hypothetical protein HHI36_014255 [Cryptolaemus montrouzieri]|uniref:Uncharacterized protein n=1 Tax=Cryptolaemus montrouzieri TaxID=559131 RepID=A0ABD2N300_9CUCU